MNTVPASNPFSENIIYLHAVSSSLLPLSLPIRILLCHTNPLHGHLHYIHNSSLLVPLFLPLGSSLFTILCLLYPLSFLCTRPNDLNLASAPLSPNHSTWGILVMYSLVIRSIRVMLSKILAPSDPLPGPLSDILLVPLFSNHTIAGLITNL